MDDQRGRHNFKELLANPPEEFRVFERRAHTDNGYLDELDHAWAMMCAEGAKQTDIDAASVAIVDCVCYALIRTSINSFAVHYSPDIVVRALELGVRPARWALSVAANIPKQDRQIRMYVALVDSGQLDQGDSEAAQRVVLDVVLTRKPVPGRMAALGELAPYLSEQVLKSAFNAIFALRPDRELKSASDPARAQRHLEIERSMILATLAPRMSKAQLMQALDSVLALEDLPAQAGLQSIQVALLHGLVAYLSQAQLARVLEVVLALKSEADRVEMLVALASHLSEAVPRALDATLMLKSYNRQAALLHALVPHLNEAQLARVFVALIPLIHQAGRGWLSAEVVRREREARRLAKLLQVLAPHLNEAQLARVLNAVLALEQEAERATLLVTLARYVKEALPPAFDAVLALKDKAHRGRLLITLARHVKEALPQVLDVVLVPKDRTERARLLVELARHAKEVLPQALDAVLALKDEDEQLWLLAKLAPHQSDILPQVINAVLALPAGGEREGYLQALAPHLDKHLLAQVLDTALVVGDSREIAGMLEVLAQQPAPYTTAQATWPRLTSAQAESAVAAALAIKDQQPRLQALIALLPRLADPAPVRKMIYQLLFGMVRSLRERERHDLFKLCAIPNLFAPPLFAEGTAAAIERQIREISEKWRWL